MSDNLVYGDDGVPAENKQPVKAKSGCCGFCRLNGADGKPASENRQNENREGEQILAEVMEV